MKGLQMGDIEQALDRARFLVDQVGEDEASLALWKALDGVVRVLELLMAPVVNQTIIPLAEFEKMMKHQEEKNHPSGSVVQAPTEPGDRKLGKPHGGLYL